MLVLDPRTDAVTHATVRDLPPYLDPGDLLVLNDSRVLPARLLGRRRDGGEAEVLLLRPVAEDRHRWEALLRPMPTPPYIKERLADAERYQTVYARDEGSAAAPTAGLHFTPDLLSAVRQRGVGLAFVTLHVGLDTFRPVRVDDPAQHQIHREWYRIDDASAEAIRDTRRHGRRVVAVGTTCVRVLETAATDGGVAAGEGWTGLMILPGHRFRVVDALLTNFHLPRSTLLMLVSAFAGRDRVLAAYAEAIRERYRFYSFGDCMFITRP